VPEEVHHFLEFLLGLVHAGHVGKGHAGVLRDVHLGTALADLHQPTHALLLHQLADQQPPQTKEDQRGQDPRQHIAQQAALQHRPIRHFVGIEPGGQLGLHPHRHQFGLALFGGFEAPAQVGVGHHHLLQPAILQSLLELAVGHQLGLTTGQPILQAQQQQQRGNPVQKVPKGLAVHAGAPSKWGE